ncbi:hypothetical protein NXC14_PA00472 (plasmid) [Rhizobium sp. NXC14]|nr:hypothetical protein NXC14_PA00472 [Rhizobium sp. NXC14]
MSPAGGQTSWREVYAFIGIDVHKEAIKVAKYLVCTRGTNMGASIERKLKFMAALANHGRSAIVRVSSGIAA